MKKIILLISISTFLFSKTGIITSKGFQGYGAWVEINKPFTSDNKVFYDFSIEYYSSIGLELSAGAMKIENIDLWNKLGVAYHFKFQKMGIRLKYTRMQYSDNNDVSSDLSNLTIYRTGKFNPFIKFSNNNGYLSYNDTRKNHISIGGLGRITRFLTLSCSVNIPINDGLMDMNSGSLQTCIGFVY